MTLFLTSSKVNSSYISVFQAQIMPKKKKTLKNNCLNVKISKHLNFILYKIIETTIQKCI